MTMLTKRFLTVIGCVLAGIAAGFLIEVLLSDQKGAHFGHSQRGHATGWIGLAVILTVLVYSVKKRYGRNAGRSAGWFWVHQIAGIVGPLLILIHSGPHFHALVPMLALLTMWMVVLSGVIGVAVHRKAVGLLRAGRKELQVLGLSREDVELRLYELASAEENFRIWQMIHVPLSMIFLALTIIHVVGALYFGGL